MWPSKACLPALVCLIGESVYIRAGEGRALGHRYVTGAEQHSYVLGLAGVVDPEDVAQNREVDPIDVPEKSAYANPHQQVGEFPWRQVSRRRAQRRGSVRVERS